MAKAEGYRERRANFEGPLWRSLSDEQGGSILGMAAQFGFVSTVQPGGGPAEEALLVLGVGPGMALFLVMGEHDCRMFADCLNRAADAFPGPKLEPEIANRR